jgi:hypothetical protein
MTAPPTQLKYFQKNNHCRGHLHDGSSLHAPSGRNERTVGGTLCGVRKNGSPVCDSTPAYCIPSGYGNTELVTVYDDWSEPHISDTPMCFDVSRHEAGDKRSIEVFYDIKAYAPMMLPNGTCETVIDVSLADIPQSQRPFLRSWPRNFVFLKHIKTLFAVSCSYLDNRYTNISPVGRFSGATLPSHL